MKASSPSIGRRKVRSDEVLLQIARVSDAVKADARLEEQAILDRAADLEQIVTATRSELGSFLRETLEKLDRLGDEMDHRSWADRVNHDESSTQEPVGDLTLGGWKDQIAALCRPSEYVGPAEINRRLSHRGSAASSLSR